MIAIILCAGFGTRLLPLTKNTPKALLDVAGRPVLDYIIPHLLEIPGLESIHLVSNAQFFGQLYAWQQQWLGSLEAQAVSIHLYSDASLEESQRLGSVGDLGFVLRALDEPRPALIIGDDTILRFPLRPIAEQFMQGDDNLVLAISESSHQLRQRLTILEIGEEDFVKRMYDQPEDPPTEWACPMVYFLQPQALAHVQPYLQRDRKDHDSLPRFMDFLVQKEPVRALRIPERETRTWFDVESKYMYKRANEILSEEPLMLEGLLQ
jgi:NDP-sugar pyrophosphorylase family protein